MKLHISTSPPPLNVEKSVEMCQRTSEMVSNWEDNIEKGGEKGEGLNRWMKRVSGYFGIIACLFS